LELLDNLDDIRHSQLGGGHRLIGCHYTAVLVCVT
jgi:hypothetical protein